ncbi:TPA: Abi family protein, partial [Escherichia coli]
MAVPVKVHKEYDELVDLLLSRGMDVPDREHAIKKISQVGYYRLSGFWYPCRIPHITTDNI